MNSSPRIARWASSLRDRADAGREIELTTVDGDDQAVEVDRGNAADPDPGPAQGQVEDLARLPVEGRREGRLEPDARAPLAAEPQVAYPPDRANEQEHVGDQPPERGVHRPGSVVPRNTVTMIARPNQAAA
jgi:hypothetical protein